VAKLRAYEQKCHIRPSLRGELARDNETHRFERYGKWQGCAVTVHVLIWGDLFNLRCRLLCKLSGGRLLKLSRRPGGYSSEIERIIIATQQSNIALIWVTLLMIKQKSADGIVAKCPS